MAWNLTQREFEALMRTEPPKRYRYFLNHVGDSERAWTLADDEGRPVVGDIEGRRVIPLWPHSRYAQAAVDEGWVDTRPTEIPLAELLEAMIPAAEADEVIFAVFPVIGAGQFVVAPDELGRDLGDELAKY